MEHWVTNKPGMVQQLASEWQTKPGLGVAHLKHGRLASAISEDYVKFFDAIIRDLEVLERDHFIENQRGTAPDLAVMLRGATE